MAEEPTARNAWAPEASYDTVRKQWVIFWASTVPGRFPETEVARDKGYDHRIYSMTTKDERKDPLVERLRLAFTDSPQGHWRGTTEPFTRDWVDGPSVVKTKNRSSMARFGQRIGRPLKIFPGL